MRKKWLIAVVLLVLLILAGVIAARRRAPAAPAQSATRRVPVSVQAAEVRLLERLVVAHGNVLSRNYASVAARVAGTIEEFFVAEGDPVVAGQTRLFQIDALKLRKALEVAQQSLAVTRCALAERQAGVERAAAELRKADLDRTRFERLLQGGAATESDVERARMVHDQAQAAAKLARASVELAAEQVRQAEATVKMAEKDLLDSLVLAPITGSVSRRMMEKGEMAHVGSPVLRIEDTGDVEVAASLPAACYPQVLPGQTRMRVALHGRSLGEHPVFYRSPTIDTALRTFEVKCRLANRNGLAVPGAMVEVELPIEQRRALAVPAAAIVTRAGAHALFLARGDTARLVPVQTGLEHDGWTEIVRGDLAAGDPVVVRGQFLLNDGAPVVLRKE